MIEPASLTLGTAALGMRYGVANPPGVPNIDSVFAILDLAWDAGMTWFDTAPAYGAAEARIGAWARSRGRSPSILTKLPALDRFADADVPSAVASAVARSAHVLGGQSFAGYLTHKASDYLRPAVRDCLRAKQHNGAFAAFGLSVYAVEDVFAALEAEPPGLIQIPLSALDQRMATSGALAACLDAGTLVFARSIFLQGLILIPPENIPAALHSLREPVRALQRLAAETGTTTASLALCFVRDLPQISSTIIGVHAPTQVRELTAAAAAPPLAAKTVDAILEIAQPVPSGLLDPRNWPA